MVASLVFLVSFSFPYFLDCVSESAEQESSSSSS